MAAQDLLDVSQCAEMLGFSEEHVRVLARKARIPAAKIGGRWRFSRRQVLAWFEEMVDEQLLHEGRRRLVQARSWRRLEDVVADLDS